MDAGVIVALLLYGLSIFLVVLMGIQSFLTNGEFYRNNSEFHSGHKNNKNTEFSGLDIDMSKAICTNVIDTDTGRRLVISISDFDNE